jgi:hypothetical protein
MIWWGVLALTTAAVAAALLFAPDPPVGTPQGLYERLQQHLDTHAADIAREESEGRWELGQLKLLHAARQSARRGLVPPEPDETLEVYAGRLRDSLAAARRSYLENWHDPYSLGAMVISQLQSQVDAYAASTPDRASS